MTPCKGHYGHLPCASRMCASSSLCPSRVAAVVCTHILPEKECSEIRHNVLNSDLHSLLVPNQSLQFPISPRIHSSSYSSQRVLKGELEPALIDLKRGVRAQVKEVALMHSEGILAGEMKHGPLALVDELLPIIVIATRDRMYQKMLSVVQQLLARGARLIILCNSGDSDMQEICASGGSRLIQVPPSPTRSLPC